MIATASNVKPSFIGKFTIRLWNKLLGSVVCVIFFINLFICSPFLS